MIRWLKPWKTLAKAVCPVTAWHTARGGISCVLKIRQQTQLSSLPLHSVVSELRQFLMASCLLALQIRGCKECCWTAIWLRLSSQIHLQFFTHTDCMRGWPLWGYIHCYCCCFGPSKEPLLSFLDGLERWKVVVRPPIMPGCCYFSLMLGHRTVLIALWGQFLWILI